ncbi:MAG: hypothetical protein M9905_15040 [Rhizobiaceae bacterium]|nr:hypothetical protein [Rhizobiaceae bacterium]
MGDRLVPIISGRSWVTALGDGIEPVMDRLVHGDTGIAPSRRVDAAGLRNDRCGEVDLSFPDEPRARLRALTARVVADALGDAGLDSGSLDPDCVIVIGTSFGNVFHNEDGPVALDEVLSEALRDLGIVREPIVLSAACSSSTEALGLAYDLISLGHCDSQVIAVGVDVIDRYKMAGHSSLSTMSPDVCRPFDAEANGTILGEGAAAMVLEAAASAERRDAPRRGCLAGVSSTTDTAGATSPDPDGVGAVRVLLQALASAGRGPAEVAYVNAHGSGTPVNDAMEVKAFRQVFGGAGSLVSSTKSAFGHTLGATGIMEAIVALESLRRGIAPPTVGLSRAAEEPAGLDLVMGKGRAMRPDAPCAMSVTYGFGGANAAIVLELGGN